MSNKVKLTEIQIQVSEMVELIRRQRHFIGLLSKSSPKQRKQLLKTISREQLKALSEIAHNVIKAILILSIREKEKLRKRKRLIHLLGNKTIGFKRKRNFICQHQRGILVFIETVLPHLQNVIQ